MPEKYTIPLAIVSILADGKLYSIEQLKECLHINPVAIKNHIQTLRNWGLNVLSILGEWYYLLRPIQLLDEAFICNQIERGNVKVLSIVDSTNQYLLEHLEELCSGDACISEYQKMGRGRCGRKWFSPFGVNIYLSMYWYFEDEITTITGLSLVIGIVVVEILEKLNIEKIRVKWPNDLYLQDRKLAGVLLESIGAIGKTTHLVIGIGINLAMHRTDNKVLNKEWINLQDVLENVDRNLLVVLLIKELRSSLLRFREEGLTPFLARWNLLDNFINCPVRLSIGNKFMYGISRGINSKGALLLEHDGVITPWIGNEISLSSMKN